MSDDMVRGYLTKDQPASNLMLLVNPFTKLAGWPALGLGVLVVAATAVIAEIGGVAYDGIMDVHLYSPRTTAWLAPMAVADWLIVALLFWIAGSVLGTGARRVVDYFGMSAVGRLPFFLVGLLWTRPLFGMLIPSMLDWLQRGRVDFLSRMPGLAWLMVGAAATMVIMLWGLFLNFFALRESSGIKTERAIAVYIGVVVVGEIVSKALAVFVMMPGLLAIR